MIQIPAAAKVIRDSRLTIVRVIGTLYDREIKGDGGIKGKIVADMVKKKAEYAESDHVVAKLNPARASESINPEKFYKLMLAKKITLAEFLSCVSVGKGAAETLLSPKDVAEICDTSPAGKPSLTTEFKPGIAASLDDLDLSQVVLKMLLREPKAA